MSIDVNAIYVNYTLDNFSPWGNAARTVAVGVPNESLIRVNESNNGLGRNDISSFKVFPNMFSYIKLLYCCFLGNKEMFSHKFSPLKKKSIDR